ncbi:MAG: sugar ABC transporter ATP-binding protein [Desulfobacteraceae bacterium]|jgi:simple sugar transport system ATP-binding protein
MTKNNTDLLIEIKGVSKSFPGVRALDRVDFRLFRGEVHGLLGENGAGKSTLIKVLTGLYPRDEGEILFQGEPFSLGSPLEAAASGISTLYQEINLIPSLSVAENIYIGRQPMKKWGIDWNRMNRDAKKAIRRLDLDIDVTRPVSAYPVAVQQMVAITRALEISARVLILDEPTSSLDPAEVEQLFKVIRHLKRQGMGIVFITHFIDQVYAITDRITVLRNGAFIGEFKTKELPRLNLIAHMLGKDPANACLQQSKGCDERQKRERTAETFIEAKGLGRKGSISAFDLRINKGEIVGLAGLLGSGRSETARLLFGIDRSHSGAVRLDGEDVSLTCPRKAIRHFLAFCPEDRKAEGIIADLTVRENIILALQARSGIFGAISRKKQIEIADYYIRLLRIKTPSAAQAVKNLSGGNQQKVIIARWLATDPRCLILDEPTRGIDVGAKAEIKDLIFDLRKKGLAILFISSELEEVISCSDRIAVLKDRKFLTELTGDDMQESTIMAVIAHDEAA